MLTRKYLYKINGRNNYPLPNLAAALSRTLSNTYRQLNVFYFGVAFRSYALLIC